MSKLATIFAPVIAEIQTPKNLVILLSISVTATIISQFLVLGTKEPQKIQEEEKSSTQIK